MSKPALSPSRGGIAGMALLFCIAAGGAGLGFDFAANSGPSFWVLESPGARGVLGAGLAAILVVGAHLLRLLLGRKASEREPRASLRP